MNNVVLRIQRREKLLLVKDQRSFLENGIHFIGTRKGTHFPGPRRRARISLVEIGVEEGITTQTKEHVSKVPRRETRACL